MKDKFNHCYAFLYYQQDLPKTFILITRPTLTDIIFIIMYYSDTI